MALDALIGFVMAAIAVTMLVIIGNVLFAKIQVIFPSNLSTNETNYTSLNPTLHNASVSIGNGFSLLSTAQGIILLVIVVGLLGLALAYFMGVFSGKSGKK